ncbi:MAG: acylphosphatase [bacterium]|nr:acylphosphatase [bacterium]
MNNIQMKHIVIRVVGRVQGVSFRARTRDKALELGLRGFVRNEPDGTVLIEAEGDQDSLNSLVQWCHEGPDSAQVDSVMVDEAEIQHFAGFVIQR